MSPAPPSSPFRTAYLHGFASGPLATKGLALEKIFAGQGRTLHRPDLNRPSFAELTYAGALAALDEMDARIEPFGAPWQLIGSSMGGYLATRWAELNPDRVDRLVLLCPGFDMQRRWPKLMGEQVMARWERAGTIPLPVGSGTYVRLHWAFIEDTHRHPPEPEVPCPTLILHGVADETVPIEISRAYARARERVELVELEDDHRLLGSVDRIGGEALAFFGVATPR